MHFLLKNSFITVAKLPFFIERGQCYDMNHRSDINDQLRGRYLIYMLIYARVTLIICAHDSNTFDARKHLLKTK